MDFQIPADFSLDIPVASDATERKEIKPLAPGPHQAIISYIVLLPNQEKTWQGETKVKNLIRLGFQTKKKLLDVDGVPVEEGRCYSYTQEYTLSMSDKSTLKKHFGFVLPLNDHSVKDIVQALLGLQVTIMTTNNAKVIEGVTKTTTSITGVGPKDEDSTIALPEKCEVPYWLCRQHSENYVIRAWDVDEAGVAQAVKLGSLIEEK